MGVSRSAAVVDPGAHPPSTLSVAVSLDCEGVGKSYDGVPVLHDVTISFAPGTLTVLVGENGAGKSTLFRILSGQTTPDTGSITIGGKRVHHFEPRAALAAGVSIIPQELLPIPDMRIFENLFLGRETLRPGRFLSTRRMQEKTREMLSGIGLDLDPRRKMRQLSIAQIQLIEILKATSGNAKIVLMDEPTSSLSTAERTHLFDVIARLKAEKVTMIYTSHKMEEIEEIADWVAVLRDGRVIRRCRVEEVSERQLITDMIGRPLGELFPEKRPPRSDAPICLDARGVRVSGFTPRNTLAVRSGEIVGLGGLAGAGRSELMEALFGLRHAEGEVALDGRPLALGATAGGIRRGLAMVPEDRKLAGVLTTMSIFENVALPYLGRFVSLLGWVRRRDARRQVLEAVRRTGVRYARLSQKVGHLSGGNQQKVALARWLIGGNPRVLILDEPTRGIDVAARGEIYRLICDLAAQGVAILLASSDMPELLGLSHRVLVMRRGAIVGELGMTDMDQETVLRFAMGVTS